MNRQDQNRYYLSLDPKKKDKRQSRVIRKTLKRIERAEKRRKAGYTVPK